LILPKYTYKVTVEEDGNDLYVKWEGDSKHLSMVHALEALLKRLTTFDAETPFQDGVAPKRLSRTWYLPLKSRKARSNPKGKKSTTNHKVPKDALQLYRLFNGEDPKEITEMKIFLPDKDHPLVALGEGDCPFIGYSSAKDSKTGDLDDYVHHFGEEGGTKPRLCVTMPPEGYAPILMIIGGDWKIEERADGKYWLVD